MTKQFLKIAPVEDPHYSTRRWNLSSTQFEDFPISHASVEIGAWEEHGIKEGKHVSIKMLGIIM
jgi:hypothetical protein